MNIIRILSSHFRVDIGLRLIVLLFSPLLNVSAEAQDEIMPFAHDEREICNMRVRLLHGVRSSESIVKSESSGKKSAVNRAAATRPAVKLHEASLSDLKGQLGALPWDSYEVSDKDERRIPLLEEATFELSDRFGRTHTVSVIAQEHASSKVKLEVGWIGPDGEELIQTQLAVDNGMNVVVGQGGESAEEQDRTPTVVCIKVSCS